MLLCKQAEQGVPLQAEQYDWLANTDEEVNKQELEAHYSYMAKIQEVPTADSGTDSESVNSNTCLVEMDDTNVTPDSPDMCEDDIHNDQNDVESDDELLVHQLLYPCPLTSHTARFAVEHPAQLAYTAISSPCGSLSSLEAVSDGGVIGLPISLPLCLVDVCDLDVATNAKGLAFMASFSARSSLTSLHFDIALECQRVCAYRISCNKIPLTLHHARTVNVAAARENVGSKVVQQSGIQSFNCKEYGHFAKECRKPKKVKDSAYHKEKMLLCKQAEQGVPLQAEQYDWLANTDEEVNKQELEAHYSYMAKIQEVPTADSGTDSESVNRYKTMLDIMCLPIIYNILSNLNLQLKKANTTLAQELKECKDILTETSKSLRESISV
nr:hypothetical protein [Tanacetum cinerariifolium]